MKKIVTIVLMLTMIFSLTACGSENNDINSYSNENNDNATEITDQTEETDEAEDNNEVAEDTTIYRIGDSAETDILRITLSNAELAIKLNTSGSATYDEMQAGITHISNDYFTADEYDADNDLGKAYIASKGHTYVVIEYQADNLDRGSVEFDGSFNEQFITVEYNGEVYEGKTDYGASSENGYEWEKYNSSNVLLLAGTTVHFRCYVDIPTDATDLSDDFNLIFSLPNSKGEVSKFRYFVSADDRAISENQEVSVDEAIATFTTTESQEYLNNHANDYMLLSGDEISSDIIGKKWDIIIKEVYGSWSGKFNFESTGTIQETIYDGSTGYFNNRTWEIDGDSLVLKSEKSDGNICEVRKIKDNVYLLIKDGAPYALLQ